MGFGFMKTMELEKELLDRDLKRLKEDNELAMIGRQEALQLRDRYNLSNELLKQGLLSGISVEEMEYILNKVKNSDIDIDYNIALEVFLTYKDLEKRVNKNKLIKGGYYGHKRDIKKW